MRKANETGQHVNLLEVHSSGAAALATMKPSTINRAQLVGNPYLDSDLLVQRKMQQSVSGVISPMAQRPVITTNNLLVSPPDGKSLEQRNQLDQRTLIMHQKSATLHDKPLSTLLHGIGVMANTPAESGGGPQ